MRLELAYADTTQPVGIPDRNLLGILNPADYRPFHDTEAALSQAAEACAAFVTKSQRILVLVNDYTRPTPNAPVLDVLRAALSDKDVKYMVCAGTHRPPTETEYRTIFGPDFYAASRDRIFCHDSKDNSRLFFVGKTSFGTDVRLSKELLWADRVVTINSIEPHYFAGYTGGRKGFLPGIAGYDAVTQNHNMVTRPGSTIFGLKGNPVHEDMVEAAKMVPRPVFSIQLVQDRNHRLLSVRHGGLFESFDAAVQDAHKVFAVPIQEKADIVLSVLRPPYDINFYQSQRAVEFARPALKGPGVQITVSACRDGIGNDGFIQAFKGCNSPSDILSPTRHSAPPSASHISPLATRNSCLGYHKSARLAQIMQTTELYTVMGIDDAVARSVFMTPFHSAQAAFDSALAKLGLNSKVYFIPDAGAVVPVLGS